MRTFSKLFGLACGCVVIAIAARYGFKTSDNDFDGYIWAFTYGSVTAGGLFGHSLALRVWRHNEHIGAIVMAASALALIISLSNSIGAMAGRGNAQQAERIKVAETVRDLRRSLERSEREREALQFQPADEAAVIAARQKASAASNAKDAECKWRGQRCRDKEAEESSALADLETATKNRAATDRAATLDSEIKALKDKIEKAGPVLEANSQGSALARLFNVPEARAATLTTYQNLAMALVIEILIVVSLVASEVLEHHETKTAEPEPIKEPVREIVAKAIRNPETAPSGLTVVPYEEQPNAFPEPAKPRLIASSSEPFGSVPTIMAALMEPARGKVEFADAFKAYAAVCREQGKRPVSPTDFSTALKQLCKGCGISIKSEGKHVFLMRVRLKSAERPQTSTEPVTA